MTTRTAWTRSEISNLYQRPLLELVFEAATVHRQHHDPTRVQCATLLSIKTGACPEDCSYCSQSAHHASELETEALIPVETVVSKARQAKANGADRFCMGAAWRSPREGRGFEEVLDMVREVKSLGLETCATLGMLNADQAAALQDAGLDYYNHNLDTSPEYYGEVIGTRTYSDRLETLAFARDAGLKLCCGGILGMGESSEDRVDLLHELAKQDPAPESVPINVLVPIAGTPLEDCPPLPWDELVRAVATARILMPKSYVRLSAGRESLDESCQAMCFLAGANSIFLGDQLLTTPNREQNDDASLFAKLGLHGIQVCEPTTLEV